MLFWYNDYRGDKMRLEFKKVRTYAGSSIIFAFFYAIMLRIKAQMNAITFIRLVALLTLLFFGLTMAVDIVAQVIRHFATKEK
jgi:hypothetical protein